MLVRSANLLDQNYKIVVIYLKGSGELTDDLAQRITVRKLTFGPLGFLRFVSEIRNFKPNVLHSHLLPADIFMFLSAGFVRGKLFCTVHNIGKGERIRDYVTTRIYRVIGIILSKKMKFICVSKSVANYMIDKAKIDQRKIVCIRNGVNLPSVKRRRQSVSKLRVLFVGRIVKQKNPFVLLNVCRGLLEKGLSLKFTLVGDGPLKTILESEISRLGLSENFLLTGNINSVDAYYRENDLLVLPSLVEGFGLVAIEAMANGLPVLASEVGGLTEIICHGENGYFCSESVEYVDKILFLQGNDRKYRMLSRNAIESVARFDLKKNVKALEILYEG